MRLKEQFYKFLKCLFPIIVVGITLLLELASKYLLKQNIEILYDYGR